ncbi:hypothetical protein F2Q68_00016262 [Brassica cretica]|uniref:Secreted protein n=1 Tax=Brassica cretica TaxID=69181 RepID=A0A8S9HT55_BRACR|nr:hypothetical protein F2Q68_00016262 [Brassica cretica]
MLGCFVNISDLILMFVIASQSKRQFRCMTSRHTRRNAQGELVTLTNQELPSNATDATTDVSDAACHPSSGECCSTGCSQASGTTGASCSD